MTKLYIVVELHGHKRVCPSKKLRCEKHFFIKAGKGIMYKRGVLTQETAKKKKIQKV